MRKFFMMVICLSMLAISSIALAADHSYCAIVVDDNSNDFFYSDIYHRDPSAYKVEYMQNDKISFVEAVENMHEFECRSCASVGLIRNFTDEETEDTISKLKEIYIGRGYSINYVVVWEPGMESLFND